MKDLLFSFKGRVGRQSYWLLNAVILVGVIATIVIDAALMDPAMIEADKGMGIVSALFMLIVLWPSLAIQVKRWHDRDKSGWWVLIGLIPIIGPIWTLIENGF